jgi:hypothetical protein
MSLEAILAAGTIVSYSLDLETPTYTPIPGVISVGALGITSEAKAKTTLADRQVKYGSGLRDAPDKSVKGQLFSSSTEQKAFITACKAEKEMLIKVEFPDKPDPDAAGTGTVGTFLFKSLGYEIDDPSGEEFMMFTVPGKQNSIVDFTDPVTA